MQGVQIRNDNGSVPTALLEGLRRNVELSRLATRDLRSLAAFISPLQLQRGAQLEPSNGSSPIYVLLEGALTVTASHTHVGDLRPGAIIDGVLLRSGNGHRPTVAATKRSRLAVLDRAGLDVLADRRPDVTAEVKRAATHLRLASRLASHLSVLLGDVPPDVRRELEQRVLWTGLRAGDVLFRQGDEGDAAYIVLSGRLHAVAEEDGSARVFGEVGAGGVVGEGALLLGRTRAATVVAVRDTELAAVPRAAFDQVVSEHPAALLGLVRTMVTRAESPDGGDITASGRAGRCLAVVAGSASVDTAAFTSELVEVLRASWTTACLDRDSYPASVCTTDAADDALAVWLEDHEELNDFVVLVGDGVDTDWTRRCVRQADRVLIVADDSDTPPAAPPDDHVGHRYARARRTLVMLHPTPCDRPRDTASWLDALAADDHHHVRTGNRDDVQRLVRHLSGSAVALVLGGGGARGFAHLGVYRLLREEGVPIDAVAGTSMGAVIAALIADQMSPDEAQTFTRTAFRRLRDYTLPVVSLLRGRRIWENIASSADGRGIEDLWLPYFCVSTDLTRSRANVHRRGALAEAMRASVSLPGVLPPMAIGGSVVVDGGVLDNLPIEEMRRTEADSTIIAVDVVGRRTADEVDELPPVVSGWRIVGRRLTRRPVPKLAGMVKTLLRATVVASARSRDHAIAAGYADCYLDLDLRGCHLLEFDAVDRVADRGYREAAAPLRAWLSGDTGRALPRQVEERPRPLTAAPAPRRRTIGRALSEERGMLTLTAADIRYRAARFSVAAVGAGLVLTLLLVMTGIVAQFRREPLEAVRAIGADQWVLREGVSGAFTSAATLEPELARSVVAATGGVPVIVARHSLQGDEVRDVVVVGHVPGHLGSPPAVQGRGVEAEGEAVVDVEAGLGLGDSAHVGGRRYEVVGLSQDTTVLAGMPLVFIGLADAQQLLYRGAPLVTGVLLSGLATQPLPPGVQSLSARQVADDALRPLERPITTVDLVRALLWIVAAGIVGAVTYLAALERQRDMAVLKAVGTATRSLVVSIAVGAVLVALAASVLAIGLQASLRPLFPMHVHLTGTDLLRLPLVAVIVAILAGVGAIRRTLGADPASAFSGPGN